MTDGVKTATLVAVAFRSAPAEQVVKTVQIYVRNVWKPALTVLMNSADIAEPAEAVQKTTAGARDAIPAEAV